MTTCSDSFWFWFMRPIAELFGGIAMVAVITLIGSLIFFLMIKFSKK